MKNINVVKKTKERRLYILDSTDELSSLDFNALIPKDYRRGSLEITYNEKDRILKVDYITELNVTKEDKEKVKEYDKTNN